MREQERPGLTARLLFMTMDRLSGRSRPVEAQTPLLQRRKTTGSRPIVRHQPSTSTQRRSSSYQAPPLVFKHLASRTRCLTPSPDGRQLLPCSTTDEQTQPPLFRLPKEVRLMIYKEVIGNRLLHIVRRQRKLGHLPCISEHVDECRMLQCRGTKVATGKYAQIGPGNGDLIQLLQSCRKIYVDAIQVLYSSNVFDFDCMEGLIAMSCALLPQRFDSIQSVRLDFRFNLSVYFSDEFTCSNDWPRWDRVWRVLASMKELRRLWLRLSWPKEAVYNSEEKRYLEPLLLVQGIEVFEVSLPSLKDEEKPWSKEIPFKIIRRTAR